MSVYLEPVVLNEAKSIELIAQLEKVPLSRMYQASFKAAIRLHIWFMGRTQELISDYYNVAQATILRGGDRDGIIDSAIGYQIQQKILSRWDKTAKQWTDEFTQVRIEAASIPFGVLAIYHERLVLPGLKKLEEGKGVVDGVFEPQLQALVTAGEQQIYKDGLTLSSRIWKWDQDSRNGINDVLMKGIVNGDSAWNIAKELEQYLGTDQDCPRWAYSRLYGLTKTDIAQGDLHGLYSDKALSWETDSDGNRVPVTATPCDGKKGVSYNALRLARTEIQKAHALATDYVMAQQPWVQNEKINTSPSHGEPDECDEVAAGGDNNDGIYPVGTIKLPLHPNCLCFKTADLIPEKEFTSKLNAWVKGEGQWEELDNYAQMLGANTASPQDALNKSILPNAINLAIWLFDRKPSL